MAPPSKANAKLKVVMPGKGTVTLGQNDHVATGGEGSVYLVKGYAYKIFTDPVLAQKNGVEAKIKLLSSLSSKFICAPVDKVTDEQHQFIGYYMPAVTGDPLVKTFSNSWRAQTGFSDMAATSLVANMRAAVTDAHSIDALIVDGNEMNYLVRGVDPIMIDVDSWGIGGFKPTAIMASIRDYHAQEFSKNTDWFSWAIVSFQVFTGIHPYKGSNPGFKKGDMLGRMKANVSVFDAATTVNSAVRDFDCIPRHLKNWYEEVFQAGLRGVPPDPLASAIQAGVTKKQRTVHPPAGAKGVSVTHLLVKSLPGKVAKVLPAGLLVWDSGNETGAYDVLAGGPVSGAKSSSYALACGSIIANRTSKGFLTILSQIPNQYQGKVIPGDKDPVPADCNTNVIPLQGRGLVQFGGMTFVQTPGADYGWTRIESQDLGGKTMLFSSSKWPINTLSTKVFKDVAVMDVLGTKYLITVAGGGLDIKPCHALRGMTVLDGIAAPNENFVALLAMDSSGQVYRMLLSDPGDGVWVYGSQKEPVDYTILNAAINNAGIYVEIPEDGELFVLSVKSGKSKEVKDHTLRVDMNLFSVDNRILYHLDDQIYQLSIG